MSDISTTSYCKDNSCDNGLSPMFMILILLLLCGGNSCLLGGCNGNNSCSSGNGIDGMLPILLILLLCGGGSLFNF